MKEIIATKSAPAAIGPYSQGIGAGNLVITSGQLPVDPAICFMSRTSYLQAIASISTRASFGNLATSTALRAGAF